MLPEQDGSGFSLWTWELPRMLYLRAAPAPTPAGKEGEGGEAVLWEPGWPLLPESRGEAWAGPLKPAYNRERGEDEGQHTPPQRQERKGTLTCLSPKNTDQPGHPATFS